MRSMTSPLKSASLASIAAKRAYQTRSASRSFTTTHVPTTLRSEFAQVRHLLSLKDLSIIQIQHLIRRSLELKKIISDERKGIISDHSADEIYPILNGKTMGMIFTKRSTRTRVSAETAWVRLGGHPMFLGKEDIQLAGGGESMKDTAIVVSSMVDALFARVGAHEEIELLAKHSTVPVINALTAKYHPLQALADIMTIYEAFTPPENLNRLITSKPSTTKPTPILPALRTPLKLAWIGDANNIINSLLVSLPRLGVTVSVATPPKYPIDSDVVKTVQKHLASHQAADSVTYHSDPLEAVKDAHVIVTDTWVSMGQEDEKAQRLRDFKGFQVTEQLAREGGANPNWKFMHCLPRKPEEVDDEVFYSDKRSLVFQEAENRKYTVMAVFEALMGNTLTVD
ncbi:ornithine carbamoyltransferase [Blyttiomyces sp. JEL0837]|nr:ornithine carbamoyltransferase [Blyttiomyces sp. JEL0837]